jgi:hypothetical protein
MLAACSPSSGGVQQPCRLPAACSQPACCSRAEGVLSACWLRVASVRRACWWRAACLLGACSRSADRMLRVLGCGSVEPRESSRNLEALRSARPWACWITPGCFHKGPVPGSCGGHDLRTGVRGTGVPRFAVRALTGVLSDRAVRAERREGHEAECGVVLEGFPPPIPIRSTFRHRFAIRRGMPVHRRPCTVGRAPSAVHRRAALSGSTGGGELADGSRGRAAPVAAPVVVATSPVRAEWLVTRPSESRARVRRDVLVACPVLRSSGRGSGPRATGLLTLRNSRAETARSHRTWCSRLVVGRCLRRDAHILWIFLVPAIARVAPSGAAGPSRSISQ